MESGSDAKPTVEALEGERRRLRELERNLAAERDRVQTGAAREIAHLQDVLRDAAERAARRERELELARKKLERKLAGGRLGRLARGRGRGVDPREESLEEREQALAEREHVLTEIARQATAETERLQELERGLAAGGRELDQVEAFDARARALAARAEKLSAREAKLEQRVDELVEVERRSVELLAKRAAELDARERARPGRTPGAEAVAERRAPLLPEVEGEPALVDRATVLDAREAELAETITRLEQRERELAVLRDQLEADRTQLAARWDRLGEAERPQVAGFREGLRALARNRGATFN